MLTAPLSAGWEIQRDANAGGGSQGRVVFTTKGCTQLLCAKLAVVGKQNMRAVSWR